MGKRMFGHILVRDCNWEKYNRRYDNFICRQCELRYLWHRWGCKRQMRWDDFDESDVLFCSRLIELGLCDG